MSTFIYDPPQENWVRYAVFLGVLVLVAVSALVWRVWRAWRRKQSRGVR